MSKIYGAGTKVLVKVPKEDGLPEYTIKGFIKENSYVSGVHRYTIQLEDTPKNVASNKVGHKITGWWWSCRWQNGGDSSVVHFSKRYDRKYYAVGSKVGSGPFIDVFNEGENVMEEKAGLKTKTTIVEENLPKLRVVPGDTFYGRGRYYQAMGFDTSGNLITAVLTLDGYNKETLVLNDFRDLQKIHESEFDAVRDIVMKRLSTVKKDMLPDYDSDATNAILQSMVAEKDRTKQLIKKGNSND